MQDTAVETYDMLDITGERAAQWKWTTMQDIAVETYVGHYRRKDSTVKMDDNV